GPTPSTPNPASAGSRLGRTPRPRILPNVDPRPLPDDHARAPANLAPSSEPDVPRAIRSQARIRFVTLFLASCFDETTFPARQPIATGLQFASSRASSRPIGHPSLRCVPWLATLPS